MPGWDNVDVWGVLQHEFGVPLYMDNDANMGALGESRCGAARGSMNMAYIKVATGIGGGLIVDGHIYRGHSGSAGELGHISIDEDGPLCVCGNRGCLETLAGARAIVEDALLGRSLHARGEANAEKGSAVSLLVRRKDQLAQAEPGSAEYVRADIADVILAAQRGDAASVAALERAGEHIGIALAGLINLFNPATIVVDGGVARAGALLLAPLRRVAAACSLPAAWNGTRILPGELGNDAIALGAVITVIDIAFSPVPHPLSS
ncbi:ROK family protein [Ktedonosporobacter rubrisoli]|uniref:ROK family protein n=1 Tax=Ktedonosporobacter rubrisoli TaxID=2509675 RepID=A0A4P6K143_KTERU|nr:ROK family protein [Ktedonosporobacter rubrisoli]QBD81695.1 ROK family protein [Ktedonosporobacter rubrisoli]